jgi:glycerol-3-phosphate acyltransferase PlsY
LQLDPIILFLSLITSYLVGSISFGRVVTRIMKPDESLDQVEMPLAGIEETYKLESIGGNTASMKLGARGGCAVGLLDILKAFIPTLVLKLLYPDQPYFLAAALAAFIGHCWPIYYKFKGGRGISPFYGGVFAFDPLGAVAVALTSLVAGMVLFKDMLIAYTGGVLLLLPWFLITKNNNPLFFYYLAYALSTMILFILAMIPEIRQVLYLRRKYGAGDMMVSMESFPMGQQMLRIMNKLGLNKSRRDDAQK